MRVDYRLAGHRRFGEPEVPPAVSGKTLERLVRTTPRAVHDRRPEPTLFADAASVLQSINVSRDASCDDKR